MAQCMERVYGRRRSAADLPTGQCGGAKPVEELTTLPEWPWMTHSGRGSPDRCDTFGRMRLHEIKTHPLEMRKAELRTKGKSLFSKSLKDP
jgi:hypothetical protein